MTIFYETIHKVDYNGKLNNFEKKYQKIVKENISETEINDCLKKGEELIENIFKKIFGKK